jgi:hypothetical protein
MQMKDKTISFKKKKSINRLLIKSLKFRLGFSTGSSLVLAMAVIVIGFMYINNNENQRDKIIKPISNQDWLMGKKFAPITIIEYANTTCLDSQAIYPTLKKIVKNNSKVNWVYRQSPNNNDKQSYKEAIALECAGSLGGNNVFWQYLDQINQIKTSKVQLSDSVLEKTAKDLKIESKKFKECVIQEKSKNKIEDQIKQITLHNAINKNFSTPQVQTPYIYIFYENQEIPVIGAKYTEDMINLLTNFEKQKK